MPGKLAALGGDGKFVSVQTTEGVLLAAAILMAIPGLMMFLSLVLKAKVNRWVNIILGVVYSIIMLLTMLLNVCNFYLLLGVVEITLTLLIVWYAWTWPKQFYTGLAVPWYLC